MIPQKYHDEEFRNNFHNLAMEETSRVNNLINELLDLVKKRESNFELYNLHRLIDKMILLISPQTNAKILKYPVDLILTSDRCGWTVKK